MFNQLEEPPKDAILALVSEFRKDPRPAKIDLSVGVYRDDKGNTPIMKAVSLAQMKLLTEQTTKAYLGLLGNEGFNDQIAKLVLGNSIQPDQVAKAQAPGGSGALRLLGELIALNSKPTTIWLSDPTWPNHKALFGAIGHICKDYPYFDADNQCVDFQAMCALIKTLPADDVIVLHGCCHNPTGCDLSFAQWQELAQLINKTGVIPLIDIAYHGLGKGLDEDVAGLKNLIESAPMTLISVSCSKNFGLYRDRVGCALVTTQSAEQAEKLSAYLGVVGRKIYSMPPDHGGAVVDIILKDESLTLAWRTELEQMRLRIAQLRGQLSATLNRACNNNEWDFIATQHGMFSLLGLNDSQLKTLKDELGIYAVKGGRVNFAGMNINDIPIIADALLNLD